MKERESLSILLLFPARTLKFNINIIRKIKGKAVNSNLKTSVYTFITCKLIKKKRIHNTMKTEIYFLKVLLVHSQKTVVLRWKTQYYGEKGNLFLES